MIKRELVQATARETGYTQEQVRRTLEAALMIVSDALAQGDDVFIQDFGRLELRKRGERKSRNFRTGEAIVVPAGRTVAFKAANFLMARINADTEGV